VLPGAITLAGGAVVICAGLYLIARERHASGKRAAAATITDKSALS